MDTGLISEQDATVLLRLVIVLESRLVVVTIRELPLTGAYDDHVKRLSSLATRRGGSHRGSGGPGSKDAR